MFDHIKLFTKTGNAVQEPDPSWTNQTIIHCSFELNLGFGTAKVVWGTGNSLKLKTLIHYFVELNRFARSFGPGEISVEFKNNDTVYRFAWTKSEGAGIRVEVYRIRYHSTRFILRKEFNWGDTLEFKNNFLVTLLNILSEKTNNEVTAAIGELFVEEREYMPYEFKIGQRVQTVVGPNVKTERIGVVFRKSYHQKDQTNLYFLLIDGKVSEKRYFPVDLKLID